MASTAHGDRAEPHGNSRSGWQPHSTTGCTQPGTDVRTKPPQGAAMMWVGAGFS
jgi:hypothetical protein